MLDKVLCDEAVQVSNLYKGISVTIYSWSNYENTYAVMGYNDSYWNTVQDELLSILGDPVMWGFSHR